MEFPEDVMCIIRAYSKPVSRGDWRQGSSVCRTYLTPVHFYSELFLHVHAWKRRNLSRTHYVQYLLLLAIEL
jgi:hypothetical protein